MRRYRRFGLPSLMLAVAAGVAIVPDGTVLAEDKPGEATGTGWAAKVQGGAAEIVLDPKQAEAVKKVSGYFNTLENLKGSFAQTDPDKAKSRGKFYLKKPGKFRFDYAAPLKKIMASDGSYLRIKEADVQGQDTYQLDNTPFRILLKKDVDLARDAKILDVQESDDLIVVALQDRSPDAPGRVQLYFTKKPGLDLKEWVVFDAQGLETRVEVSDLNKAENIDPKLFQWDGNIFNQK